MNLLSKLLGVLALVTAIGFGVAHVLDAEYDKGYAQGQSDERTAVREASDRDAAEKARLGAERVALAEKAAEEFAARAAQKEKELVEQTALAADRGALVVRLRAAAERSLRGVGVGPDPGGACAAERARLDDALRDRDAGLVLLAEGAGLLDEGAGLVGSCVGALADAEALIRLAQGWAKAVRTGATPPPP